MATYSADWKGKSWTIDTSTVTDMIVGDCLDFGGTGSNNGDLARKGKSTWGSSCNYTAGPPGDDRVTVEHSGTNTILRLKSFMACFPPGVALPNWLHMIDDLDVTGASWTAHDGNGSGIDDERKRRTEQRH